MTTLVFNLFGRDHTASKVFDTVGRSSDGAGDRLKSLTKITDALGGRVLNTAKAVGQGALKVGSLGSAALAAAPLVAKAAGWVVELGSASLAAAPAVLGLAAGGVFLAATLRQMGPAIGKALDPISEGFTKAGERAGWLATQGIRPLAGEFARINMPHISNGMDRIAESTRRVLERFLTWGKSVHGVSAIKNIVDATAISVEKIGPHLSRFVGSLGNMLGRIAGVSMAAGTSGLAGVLDFLSRKMDQVNEASVQNGLDTLRQKYLQVKHAVEGVWAVGGRLTEFYRAHRTEIGLVQDALGVLAIAFGGPAVAAAGAASLIIRHWDELKASYAGLQQYFQTPVGSGVLRDLQATVSVVVPAIIGWWNDLRATVAPILTEIWDKIRNELIPAFADWLAAVAPVVAFFVDVVGPIVRNVMEGVLGVIRGVLDILTGLFTVWTGVLTGDWQKVWDGIKKIVEGALGAIWSIVQAQLNNMLATIGLRLSELPGLFAEWFNAAKDSATQKLLDLVGFVGSIPGRLLAALGDLDGLLVDAGAAAIRGLLDGIVREAEQVYAYVSSIAGKIASLKGPLSYDLRLLVPAGAAIMAGLHAGILRGVGPVLATVAGLGDRIAGSMRWHPAAMPAGALPDLGGAGSQTDGAKHYHLTVVATNTEIDLRAQLRRLELLAGV